tara:strand:- start:5872 stop:6201 length:330 start_codon:yes stop_codon:yes gene_type:complete
MASIGQLRNRIAIQSMSTSTDAGGGQSASFSTAVTVWAACQSTGGNETVIGDQLQATNTLEFIIRYYSALTPKHRIVYNSKNYNIERIEVNLEGKEKYQIITATEGVAT